MQKPGILTDFGGLIEVTVSPEVFPQVRDLVYSNRFWGKFFYLFLFILSYATTIMQFVYKTYTVFCSIYDWEIKKESFESLLFFIQILLTIF